jgi:hypothetical protein
LYQQQQRNDQLLQQLQALRDQVTALQLQRPAPTAPPTIIVLGGQGLGGPPLQPIPLGGPPLQQIPLGGPPLQQIPLGSPPLQQVPLGAVPQQQIPLGGQPLQLLGPQPPGAGQVKPLPAPMYPSPPTVPPNGGPQQQIPLGQTPVPGQPTTAQRYVPAVMWR